MKITSAAFFVYLLTSFSTGVTAWEWPGTYCYIFCPRDQTTVSGASCYTYVPQKATGSQAESGCVKLGSHLVSINSQSEQDFVFKFWQDSLVAHTPANINANSMNSLWIGGSKSGTTWSWTDGSSWGYTNWERTYGKQPDGDGSCSHFWTHSHVHPPGAWNDVGCDNSRFQFYYMCEKPGVVSCYPFSIDWLKECLFPNSVVELISEE